MGGMTINAMTYNISWATQKNILAGSEEDFVRRCRELHRRGGRAVH